MVELFLELLFTMLRLGKFFLHFLILVEVTLVGVLGFFLIVLYFFLQIFNLVIQLIDQQFVGLFLLMKLRLITLLNLLDQNIVWRLELFFVIFAMFLQMLQSLLKLFLSLGKCNFWVLALLLKEGVLALPQSFVSIIITGRLTQRLLDLKIQFFVFLNFRLIHQHILLFLLLKILNFLLKLLNLILQLWRVAFGLIFIVFDFLIQNCLVTLKGQKLCVEW